MSEAVMVQIKSRRPTNKWFAAVITSAAAVATLWINSGAFTKEVAIAVVGLVAQALVSYLVPNSDTAGGVPTTDVPPTDPRAEDPRRRSKLTPF